MSEQEVPAFVCPGTATFTCQHLRARTHLRVADLTLMARSGLPIVAVSGQQTCDSCRFGRSLVLSPCLLQEKKGLTLLSPGRRFWGTVFSACAYLPPDACRTRRTSGHGDPTGQLPRRLRAPATSALDREGPGALKDQGRLQCNGPGIDVQVSVSKQRNSQSYVRKVQHQLFVQSGCCDT